MEMHTIYNKYLDAINACDFSILANIASNIGNINSMSFDVQANWESSVKELMDSKINDLKLQINTLTAQIGNLSNIAKYSADLKAKIEEYNKIYSSIKNLSNPSKPGKDATEAQKNDYENRKRAYEIDQDNKNKLKMLIPEIESLVNSLKSINFENRVSESTGENSATEKTDSTDKNENSKEDQTPASENADLGAEQTIQLSESDKKELEKIEEQIDFAKNYYIKGNIYINQTIQDKAENMTEAELLQYYEEHNYKEKELTPQAEETLDENLLFLAELVYFKHQILNRGTSVPTAQPSTTPVPTSTPGVTPAPTAQPSTTSAPTLTPGVTPAPTAQPSTTPVPTSTPGVTPAPTAQPSRTPAPTKDITMEYSNYDGKSALILGSKEYNALPDYRKEELNQQYLQAIEEGKRIGGTKGGVAAAANFYFENNLGMPFSASGKHNLYGEGLDTNLKQGGTAPNSASWIQMLVHDVTGEENANLRLNNGTDLNGTFLQGSSMKDQIPNVEAGDIFFRAPKNPNDSSAVGHAYYVVGREGENIMVAELGHKGFTITPKTEEELSRLDGLTILDKSS